MNMNEKERDVVRLREWMEVEGYTYRALANELGLPFQRFYHQFWRGKLEDNTRWAFAKRFGWQAARQLFDTQGETNHAAQ